ncbi:MAG: phosphoribosylglycinamide formyltransferase [Spirochaetaceae bacterium]|nr:phosphoribosylglycinamide formyltransferase [Spirochaetaceae bacterium]
MFRIAVLISGTGSNLRSLIEAIEAGILKCEIVSVISDQPNAGGLKLAEEKGIETFFFSGKTISDNIFEIVKENTDLIVCAGFLSILKGELMEEFHNRIINIHPALIPSFCGKGMYGIRVHQSAVNYGVKVSGCTVHFVEPGIDTGPIILQRTVDVLYTDTPEDLQKRILKEEHVAIVEAVKIISEGRIKINNRKVILERESKN